ncbi:MAG: Transcription initiation factor IIA small chain (TFIIA 13.5 kDa subunit) [Alyxoria varia]|nr:MAG: Transcription initiation factor IIA small chain (TFIIA 13.5 kDa subunit) [Alyxoria varia]
MSGGAPTSYELYRSASIGMALQDALDDLISQNLIEPQLAMKICSNYDKAFAELIADKVKSRLNFKGSLDIYRFCDDVWTFLIRDVKFTLDNKQIVEANRVKIVSCTNKKAGET